MESITGINPAATATAAASVVGGGGGGKQETDNADGSGLDLGVLLSTAPGKTSSTPNADLDAEATAQQPQQKPTNRFDVFQALTGTTLPGSIATGGSAKELLPSAPGLKIRKRGRSSRNSGNHATSVPLPIIAHSFSQLCEHSAEPHPNANYRNVHSIDARLVTLSNPEWDETIQQVLEKASIGLGLDYERVTATLEELLLFETGSSIAMSGGGGGVADQQQIRTTTGRGNNKNKKGTNRSSSIGSLLIQPPSEYTGGNIRISYGEGAEVEEQRFELGSGSKAAFACQYLVHYADCDLEMDPILSGHCILLSYSLQYDMKDAVGSNGIPSADALLSDLMPLKRSLANLPPPDRMVLVPLEYQYDDYSLSHHGTEALHKDDRHQLEALRVAGGDTWKFYVIEAEMTETKTTVHGYYDDIESVSFTHSPRTGDMYDEDGNKLERYDEIPRKWITPMIDYSSCEGTEFGMMMSYKMTGDGDYTHAHVWGLGSFCPPPIRPYGYGYNRYGYHDDDNDGENNKTKTKYNCNFLLAYDSAAEIELKILEGESAIEQAVEKVVAAKDYSILGRMVNTIQDKSLRKISKESCHQLLNMIVGAKSAKLGISEEDRILFANITLRNLSPSQEPNHKLYDAVFQAVESIGWAHLKTAITKLFSDLKRRNALGVDDVMSRLNFVLKLRQFVGKDEFTALFSECKSAMTALSRSNPRRYLGKEGLDDALALLESSIACVGYDDVAAVVQDFFSYAREWRNDWWENPKVSETILQHIVSLMRIKSSYQNADVSKHLRDAAEHVISKLENPDTEIEYISGERKRFPVNILSLPCSCNPLKVILDYGDASLLDRFGVWASKSGTTVDYDKDDMLARMNSRKWSVPVNKGMDVLLEALERMIAGDSGAITIPLGILNKCLVQSQWNQSSAAIKKLLQAHTAVAFETDDLGRLSLHHAAACTSPQSRNIKEIFLANPKGASVMDPTTMLYPFQLAALNGDINSAFDLLLADPSLVAGRNAGGDNALKKRKRSDSIAQLAME